jgi:hypothetical protein
MSRPISFSRDWALSNVASPGGDELIAGPIEQGSAIVLRA